MTVIIIGSNVIIKNKDEFISNYPIIFNKQVTNLLLQQPLADIQSGPKGLILGNGEIRINRVNKKIMITSIKNS